MLTIEDKICIADWIAISNQLEAKGFAILPALLSEEQCTSLKELYDQQIFRKTVVMERHRFGLGEYKYFDYPLPQLIQAIRQQVYFRLAPVANHWMNLLRIQKDFPLQHEEFIRLCQSHQQSKPTPLILKYGKGGYNTMHQDLYGEVYFPLQAVLFLSQPNIDYKGGEFVMTEQVPRAQSKAMVLQPKQGDMLLFTTNFRPVKGSNGYYRSIMKHGISELSYGERFTLGIIFHDALS